MNDTPPPKEPLPPVGDDAPLEVDIEEDLAVPMPLITPANPPRPGAPRAPFASTPPAAAPRPEVPRPDARAEVLRSDARAEVLRPDVPRPEPLRPDVPRREPSRPEAARADGASKLDALPKPEGLPKLGALARPGAKLAPDASLPIAAMPIISLGPADSSADAVEVGSMGVRRSSFPPPQEPGAPAVPDSVEELTPPRGRPPADSLVQAIPSPRGPLESDPNVLRPAYGHPAAPPDSSDDPAAGESLEADVDIEEGEPEAHPDPGRAAHPENEILSTEDIVRSEPPEPEPASIPPDEVESEPDSAPEGMAVDTRVLAEKQAPDAPSPVVSVKPAPAVREAPNDRISDVPPEVAPEDVEIEDYSIRREGLAAPPVRLKPPALGRLGLPLPLYARGAELAPSTPVEGRGNESTKRTRHWWDELFGDDFLRTMDHLTDFQLQKEVTFIEESLGVQKGGIVLDLACGSGRHAVEMAVRGYNVVGYDLSLAMLARAADEAQSRNQKLNFLHGDMRDMGFDEMFDGVYCWSTSFGYFDDEKNQAVAQRIHRSLRKGGMLLLDLANRDFVTQRQPSLVWFEGEGCVCMDEMRVDFLTSRLKVKRMVMLEDGRTRELDYSIRLYTLHELGRMLHDVGFKVTDVSGQPATPGVFMGADSPRLIVLAEKA